ncbi:hypothetical protein ACQ86D_23605 [Streptomyces galilaeus]
MHNAGTASAIGRLGALSAPITIGYLYDDIGFSNVSLVVVTALALAAVIVTALDEKTSGRSLEQLEGTPA